jgi:hypothetical protein
MSWRLGALSLGPSRAGTSIWNRMWIAALVVCAPGVICSQLVAVPVAGAATAPVFADGFESGTMAGYVHVTHSAVQTAVVHGGAWAWRATNPNGAPSFAYHTLGGSYRQVHVDAWVYLVSHASSVKLFAVRPAAQRSLEVYVDVKNRVSVRNNIGAVTTYGRTTVANGGWHRVVLDATIGSGTGKLAVAVDGVAVPGLTLTGQNLGTLAFGELRLGDTATAATFDIAIDDVAVTAVP